MKKQRTLYLEKDEILQAVEQELIQTWRDGRVAAPTSPLQAAATFAMHTLLFIQGAKTFPHHPPQPSEAEFAKMLAYIVGHYHLSPDFPHTKQQLQDDIASKIQEIQHRRTAS